MEFLEAPAFTRYVSSFLSDDEYGNCKTSWPLPRNSETLCPELEDFGSFVGQTGDVARDEEAVSELIYYYFPGEQQIWLVTLYDKNEASDLTPKEKQALKSAIETELRARRAAKLAKQRKSLR